MHPLDVILLILTAVTGGATVAVPVIAIASDSRTSSASLGHAIWTAGGLQLILLGLTAVIVKRILMQPWVLDLHPYNSLVQIMLNWFVPAA